jgi:hypothetical protein
MGLFMSGQVTRSAVRLSTVSTLILILGIRITAAATGRSPAVRIIVCHWLFVVDGGGDSNRSTCAAAPNNSFDVSIVICVCSGCTDNYVGGVLRKSNLYWEKMSNIVYEIKSCKKTRGYVSPTHHAEGLVNPKVLALLKGY